MQCSTVTSAITAVGLTIAMATGVNPTKVANSERFLLQLQIQLAGYAKKDPPTKKKLPVEADVPELLIDMAYTNKEDTFAQATADLALIAFYYLLRIGEHTIKSTAKLGKSNTKQTANSTVQTRGCNVLLKGQEGKDKATTTKRGKEGGDGGGQRDIEA